MNKLEYVGSRDITVSRDKSKKHLTDYIEIQDCPEDFYLIYETENSKIFYSESTSGQVTLRFNPDDS